MIYFERAFGDGSVGRPDSGVYDPAAVEKAHVAVAAVGDHSERMLVAEKIFSDLAYKLAVLEDAWLSIAVDVEDNMAVVELPVGHDEARQACREPHDSSAVVVYSYTYSHSDLGVPG